MDDKLKQLYELYSRNGLIKTTDFNTFSSANESQRKQLYDLGRKNGLFNTTDYNTFSTAFSPVKKKGSTGLPSQPQRKGTTSATVKTTTQKPSVSSGGKKTDYEIQMFTGFPGKEGKQYALDKSSAVPVWREKSNAGYDKAITDPARVDALNKHFKQKASSSEMEQVFTGFPGKEFNEYRVRDGKWERRNKGATSWQTVINEGSILGLNKQFKQNVEVTKDIEKAKIDQKREIDNKKNLNKLLSSVNSNLVGSSEEYASEELEKKFPGFKFIQQGLFSDNLLVIAPNDNRANISLDNFTDSDDRSQATVLREFIRNNSDEEMAAAERELSFVEREKERFLERSEKEMFENDIPSEFKFVNGKLVIDTYVDKQKKTKQYGAIEDKLKENRKKYIDKKEEQFDDIYYRFKNQPYEPNKMEAAYASVRKDDAEIKRVNDYINDVRNTSKDIASEKTKIEEEMNDLVVKLRSGEITRDQYNAEYKPAIEEKLLDLKNRGNQLANEIGNINVVNKAVDESIAKNFIIDESKGSFGGGMASKFVKGLTYIPRIAAAGSMSKKEQNDLVDLITGKGTTQEYTESSDRSDLVKSLFSLSESMGALTAGAALGGGAATYASFYAQSYYEMKDELDEIKGMTDAEKVLMSSVYGSLSSVLEKFGVDMITQKTPIGRNLKNNILKRMFSDLPKDASKEFIDAAMLNSVKMTLANAGLNAVGGAVGEGVTESLQSLSSVGIKEVYDRFNDTKYFNNKSGWEILSDVMYEGYLGALGGGVMSTVASSASVVKNGLLNAVNKEQAELLVNAAKTEGVDQALITNLKASILKGNISKEEAKVIADSFNEIKGKIQSMPDNLSISDKSVALDLMVEKDKIEKKIAGKDENLVAAQKARIADINNQLKTISEDAVQKQTAGEVPVQPEAAVSGEVAQGKPQAEPQVVTEEGQAVVQEEVGVLSKSIDISDDRNRKGLVPTDQLISFIGEDRTGAAEMPTSRKTIDRLKEDITKNGFKEPIVIVYDRFSNGGEASILEGNHRMKAAIELGLKEIPVKFEKGTLRTDEQRASDRMFPLNRKFIGEIDTRFGVDGTNLGLDVRQPNENDFITEVKTEEVEPQSAQVAEVFEFNGKRYELAGESITDIETGNLVPIELATQIREEGTPIKVEPTAQEEVVTEEPVTEVDEAKLSERVEELGRLISGNDIEIDKKSASIKNKAISKSVSKAAKSISRILPNVKFIVHDNDNSYKKATGEEGRSQSSRGEYNPKTKTIHINGTKANNRTVAHEVFHAILLDRVSSDKQASDVTRRMIDAVSKNIEANSELKQYLDNFASNYDENIQNEEKLAEFVGVLAENYMNQPPSVRDVIKRWLNKLAQFFGLSPVTSETEVMELLNTIARRVTTGKKIKEQKISKVIGKKGEPSIASINKRFQADFSDSVSKLTFVFDNNTKKFKKLEDDGYITRDKSLSDFNGNYIFLHQPDAAFSGAIYKDGELLVEGKGGVFYPIKFHEDGYFWASTDSTAEAMAKDLNKVMEQNGGTIYMALTAAPSNKLMSSTTMANAILDFFSSKAFDKNFKITPLQLKTALRRAANDVKIKKSENKKTGKITEKPFGLDLKLPVRFSLDEIQSAIRIALDPRKSSFEDRKNFALELTKLMANEINKNDVAINQFGELFSQGIQNKYFKGITKTGKLKISAANMTQALSEMFTEPMLKDGVDREKGGQVYAILELNGPVKPTKSNKHESYPMAIQSDSDNKVKLHILNDRQNWYDVFEDFETNDIVTKDRRANVYPTYGVSVRGLKLNTSKTKEGDLTQRKQLIGKNANLSQNVRDNLQVARDMEVAGKSVKDIRIATGWERGADKKWRYEIDDNILIFKSRFLDQLNNIEKPKTYGELSRIDINKIINNELIKLYPELSNTEIVINPTISYGEGYYIPSLNQIHISNNNVYLNNTASVLLHEIQHVIQNIEGFSVGSDINKVTDSVGEKLINEIESGDDAIVYNKLQSIISKMQEDPLNRKKLESGMSKIQTLLDNYSNKKYGKKVNAYAFDVYRRYAGEVEARNVEKRMNMTPEERRQTTLQETEDVSREDQLIFFEGVKSARKQLDVIINRKQKDGIPNVIEIARKNGFSDNEIREYLKRKLQITDKEATEAINQYNIKEEDIWVPSKGKLASRVKSSIQSLRKRFLSARAFLPKSVFAYKEQKEASVASHLNIVDQNVTDFNRLYDKYKGDKEQLVKDFDAYIRGDKDVELPEEFKILANSMRNQIDGLSRQLIDLGLLDKDTKKSAKTKQKIEENLGKYLTRSYKVYDNANWKNEVEEEVKQRALNFMRTQYKTMAEEIAIAENMPFEEALNNLVNNRFDELLDKEGATNFVKGSRLGSKDLSVLKERQDIPFEIRALMGEYQDPALNYARTVMKLSSLAANHKFLTEVKNAGMGKYFFEKNDPRRGREFNTQIATEGSETMNPLNGLYTTKEIAEAFEAQQEELGTLMQNFMKLQSGIRWAKTIGSVGTHFKNVIGNLGFVWINAHYKDMGKAYKVVKNDLFKLNNKERRELMNNYIKLGIVKQSAGLGEIMDMFKDANFDTAMASRLTNQKLGILGKAKRFLLQGKKKIEDAYQAEDDFFKIVAYENELSRYSKAMFGKSKSELTEQELDEVNKVVTEIVKNTYPTYDRIPEAVKMIRRFPFIGNFVSFQAEAYRTAFNTIALAKQEITSKDPDIRKIGATRLAGATSYLAAKTAVLQYVGMAAGTGLTGAFGYFFDDDDEEEKDKDIREFVAPWSKESDLLVIEAGNGKLKYIDFSATDPHGGIKKAINAFLLGESTTDSFIDGLVGVIQPFIGEEMTTEAILALKNNRDKYGKEIWNPEDNEFEKIWAISAEIYKLVEPGTISSIRRGIASEDKGQELIANLTGFRTYNPDINKQFGFKVKDYAERIKNAKRIYNSAFFKEESTKQEKEQAYKKANNALSKIYKEVISVYNSAERLGVKPDDLRNSMIEFGDMSRADISKLQAGEIPELKSKDEKSKKKVISMWY